MKMIVIGKFTGTTDLGELYEEFEHKMLEETMNALTLVPGVSTADQRDYVTLMLAEASQFRSVTPAGIQKALNKEFANG